MCEGKYDSKRKPLVAVEKKKQITLSLRWPVKPVRKQLDVVDLHGTRVCRNAVYSQPG